MGAALHYSCSEGFNLVGTASQECLPTGEWSSSTPLCMQGESLGGAVCERACRSVTFSSVFVCGGIVYEVGWMMHACIDHDHLCVQLLHHY